MGLLKFDRLSKLIKNTRWFVVLQYGAFATLLFGIKLWVIGTYGNATPYWDQWDAEAELLYKPFLNGTLGWHELLAPHNEHRIFTTRILALAILSVNSIWNPLLQMIVNAGLHIIMIGVSVYLLTRITGRRQLPALLIFSLVLFAIPYGWENTLAGFQSQFYLVVLFSIVSIWLTLFHDPLSLKWWGGIASASLAFLTLASGVFALAAIAIMGLFFYLTGIRRTSKQLIAVMIVTALFAVGIYLTPTIPDHATLKASSFDQFFHALNGIMGWPISSAFVSAVARNIPALFFAGWMIWKRPPVNDRRWFLLALVIWSVAQAISIAYGRAVAYNSSRYMDLFAIVILVNFVCLTSIAQTHFQKRRNWTMAGVTAWTALVLISLGSFTGKFLPGHLAGRRDTGFAQEVNTRNYLATGDLTHLTNKPFLHVPYPNSERLASILSSPEIRKILPTNISRGLTSTSIEQKPADAFVVNGYYPTTPARVDTTWGSLNAQGNESMGNLSIRFDAQCGGRIVIPVAGYPLNTGNKIEIEQNGRRKAVILKENPKESWTMAYVKVNPGPFSLCLTDSSPTFWLAAGTPVLTGRFDRLASQLLSHYYLFILLGVIALVFLITYNGFENKADKSME